MKRNKTISIIAVLGSSLLAAPAIAQVGVGAERGVGVGVGGAGVGIGDNAASGSANVGATAGSGVKVDGTRLDTGTTASIGANFNGALSAMERNSESAAALGTMTEVSSVNVVKVGELEGASEAQVEAAANAYGDGIRDLRAAIDGNASLKAALEAENVDTSTIVAADMAADGTVTVFVE